MQGGEDERARNPFYAFWIRRKVTGFGQERASLEIAPKQPQAREANRAPNTALKLGWPPAGTPRRQPHLLPRAMNPFFSHPFEGYPSCLKPLHTIS